MRPEQAGDHGTLVTLLLAIGAVDDGVNLRHFQRAQAGVAGHGVLHGAVQVGVGALQVALFVEQAGQLVQRGILADGALQIPQGGACQVVDLADGVALGRVGLVHGVVQVGQGLHVARVAGEVPPQDGHSLVCPSSQGGAFGAGDVGGDGVVRQQDRVAVAVSLLHVTASAMPGQRIVGHPAVARAAGAVILHAGLRLQAVGGDGSQHFYGGGVHARHAHHGGAVDVGVRLQVFLPVGGEELQAAAEVVRGRVGLIVQVFVKQRFTQVVLLQRVAGQCQTAAQVGNAELLGGVELVLAGDGLVQLGQHGADGVGRHRGSLCRGFHRHGHGGEEEYQGQYKGLYHGFYGLIDSTNNVLRRRGRYFRKRAALFGGADTYRLTSAKVSNMGENAKILGANNRVFCPFSRTFYILH